MSELMESIESLKISCEESASLPKHRAKVALTSLRDEYIDRKRMLENQLRNARERTQLLQSELLRMLSPFIENCLVAEGVKRCELGTDTNFYQVRNGRSTTLHKVWSPERKVVHYWQEPMYLFRGCPMWMKRVYPRPFKELLRSGGAFEGNIRNWGNSA